jgi:hypothetical protein
MTEKTDKRIGEPVTVGAERATAPPAVADSKKDRTRTHWQCDDCGASGHLDTAPCDGGWAGAMSVLDAHHAESPFCFGGRDTVRVSLERR